MIASESQLLPISQISVDSRTQSRIELNDAVILDYADAMLGGTKFPAVTVFFDGERYWLSDGYHRLHAARQAGFSHIASEVKQGTLRDAIYFSCGANTNHGLNRTNADKQRAVKTLLADNKWKLIPLNQIAKHCGVAFSFVHKLYHQEPSYLEDKIKPDERVVNRNGSAYVQNTAAIGIRSGGTGESLQRESYEPFVSSKSDEHYTPPEVIAAVVECLGEINLDPCSNSHIDPNVPAVNHFVKEDDGLCCSWTAPTVYLNPPYSEVNLWLQKLIKEMEVGNCGEAITLTKADPSTQWFQLIWRYAVMVCFCHKRLAFLSDSNEGNSATFPSCIAYFGVNPEKFYHVFNKKIGVCCQVVEPRYHLGK